MSRAKQSKSSGINAAAWFQGQSFHQAADYEDGYSRCECCHAITDHTRLSSVKMMPLNGSRTMLCASCMAVYDEFPERTSLRLLQGAVAVRGAGVGRRKDQN